MIWLAALLLIQTPALPGEADSSSTPVQDELDLSQGRDRERPEARLDRRLEDLRNAETEQAAEPIAEEIRSMWRQSGGATANLLLARGQEARETGDLTTAARQFTHLRRLEPEFADAWLASAQIAASQGDWPFALEAVERAIALEPRRFDAYALLGRALEQAEAWPAAQAAYEEALRVYPLMPAARAGLARVERQLSGRAL